MVFEAVWRALGDTSTARKAPRLSVEKKTRSGSSLEKQAKSKGKTKQKRKNYETERKRIITSSESSENIIIITARVRSILTILLAPDATSWTKEGNYYHFVDKRGIPSQTWYQPWIFNSEIDRAGWLYFEITVPFVRFSIVWSLKLWSYSCPSASWREHPARKTISRI